VTAYGRVSAGATPEQVRADLERMTAAMIARAPQYRGFRVEAGEPKDWITPDVRMSLWLLLGAVTLVLVIACVNIAGLLLSRAAARRREVAIRAALGAGRRRLIAQMLAECAPLAVAGCGLGLLFADWGVRLLPRLDVSRIPRLAEARIDGALLAFAGVLAAVTCLLFGLAPALALWRVDLCEALRGGGWPAARSWRGGLRAATVAFEVGLALVLSFGATLMAHTFHNLATVAPGFNPEHVLTASLELPRSRFTTKQQVVAFYDDVLARVRALPGVRAAG
jgi:putative ABC transport system permease protein